MWTRLLTEEMGEKKCYILFKSIVSDHLQVTRNLPGHSTTLHVVGQRDVIAPHVKLPLAQAKDTAQDVTGVDADSHVHVEAGRFSDEPSKGGKKRRGQG